MAQVMETMVSYSSPRQARLKTMSYGGCIKRIAETRDEDQVVDRNSLTFACENLHTPYRTCKVCAPRERSGSAWGLGFHEMETRVLLGLSVAVSRAIDAGPPRFDALQRVPEPAMVEEVKRLLFEPSPANVIEGTFEPAKQDAPQG